MTVCGGRSQRLLRTGGVTLALSCLPVLLAPSAHGQTAVTSGAGTAATSPAANVLQVWAPKFMERNGSMSLNEAVEQAKRFDFILAKPQDNYQPYVSAMRAANPRLKLIVYLNGTFADNSEGSAFDPSWYVRDPSGAQVRSVRYGNYMMDPAAAGWVDDRMRKCVALLASTSFDGCGLDVLGTTPVTDSGFVTGTPLNARTGLRWTPQEWLAATTALAGSVRSGIAPRLVLANGIGDGPRYFSGAFPSRQLLDGADIGMVESFLRSPRGPLTPYPTAEQWKANVDMLIDAGTRGKSLVVVTKVWNTGTAAEKDAWHKFALASFLLGNDGSSRFSFLYDEAADPAAGHPWWSTQLGAPLGAYVARSDGTFSREFASGRALVNPGTTTVKVRLGGTFKTLDGRYVRYVVLGPHSGEVLTR